MIEMLNGLMSGIAWAVSDGFAVLIVPCVGIVV